MNWVAPLGLLLVSTGTMAVGCSAPPQADESSYMLKQVSSEDGALRIRLDEETSGPVVAKIEAQDASEERSITIEITDAKTGERLAMPTLFPVGSANNVVIDIPDGTQELKFSATDTLSGRPLGDELDRLSVELSPPDR